MVIDGGAISKLSATIDANFARRSKINDRAHPEFIDDAISPLGGQAMQGVAAKQAPPPQPHPSLRGIAPEIAKIVAAGQIDQPFHARQSTRAARKPRHAAGNPPTRSEMFACQMRERWAIHLACGGIAFKIPTDGCSLRPTIRSIFRYWSFLR